jgi:arylsulfatase A
MGEGGEMNAYRVMTSILTLFTTLLLAPLTAPHAADTTAKKPNIVIILADDLGYGDVQCYNPQRGRIPTPNMDRLAAQGIRFTDGHSSSGVCSPSRYTLLTGRYHWRTRLQSGIVGVFGQPLIAPDRMTLGTLAKQHGYRTAAIGKWHLGWDWPIPTKQRRWFQLGKGGNEAALTDEQLAAWREVFSQPIPGGPTTRGFDEYFGTDVPNWPPFCFIENDRTQGIPNELLPRNLRGNNLASLPGPALQNWKLEGILPALSDRACDFIASQATAKRPFLLYLPLTTPHTPLAVNAAWRDQSGLNNAAADLIMETDATVGRVLHALEKSGVADETLVLFTSDNGFAPYVGADDLEKRGHFPSGPLRGYKSDVWEGGHRVPFIVRWPGVVKPGGVCGQLVHHADMLRTLADVLDTPLPDNAGEDSFSLLPVLKGNDKPIRPHAVSCAAAGTPGLRQGDWKFIPGSKPGLYNLADDLGETKNLAGDKPELVAEMRALLEKLITDGRSTTGSKQPNDVEVHRFHASASSPPSQGK